MTRRSGALASLLFALAVSGCTNGDFGRVRPMFVTDGIHDWVGQESAAAQGIKPSKFPLTDDERLLRDLAFPMIDPPYERNRWYSVLNEYGLNRVFMKGYDYDVTIYFAKLMSKPYRSSIARYHRVNDDIRDDVNRIGPFFALARRVLDTDAQRQQAMKHVHNMSHFEWRNAEARVAENALVVAWVQESLKLRSDSYRFAIERLVLETPMQAARETQQSLALMRQRMGENQLFNAETVVALSALPSIRYAGAPVGAVAIQR
jgi:hypothetical protein